MTVFRGHTENAGHFLQLAIMAIGHKVIARLLLSRFEHRAERDVAHERYCERVGAEVQTNSGHLGTAKEASASIFERAVPRAFQNRSFLGVSHPPRVSETVALSMVFTPSDPVFRCSTLGRPSRVPKIGASRHSPSGRTVGETSDIAHVFDRGCSAALPYDRGRTSAIISLNGGPPSVLGSPPTVSGPRGYAGSPRPAVRLRPRRAGGAPRSSRWCR